MSQDPVSSHFYANSLQLNPALAGTEGPLKVYIGYRNQWPNSGKSFITYQAAYDQYVDKLQGGIGVRVMNDRQGGGIFNAYNLDAIYAYHFRTSRRLSFSGGLQAGVGQRSFNAEFLTFGDMFDPVSGDFIGISAKEIESYNTIYPDFAAGGVAFFNNFYGGFALHHLFNPLVGTENDDAGRLSRKYSVHLGGIFSIIERRRGKEIMLLSPNLIFIQQQNIQQINYGLDLIFKDVLLGLWTRHDLVFNYGNVIFTAGYTTQKLRFRYSYDIRLSSPTIRLPNLGAHEISLLIIYENSRKRKKHRAIKCPKI
jgi:type IX secretion system PorP/SprF family membrane protein